MKRIVLLAVLLLINVGCDSQKQTPATQQSKAGFKTSYKTILQTGVSGVEKAEKLFTVIKDAQALREFNPKIEPELISSIDFSRETLVGVYGGDDIRIAAIESTNGCNRVRVTTKEFGENSPFYGIPYSPMHLVKVNGTGSCFQFDETVVTVQ